ncbi:hypothetical protein AOQ84DRAFT_367801 [Glonium stellatum]|uniref:Uncharacterized protein n=1 Tax=Glonium stellatum TaxID=574774 RepID=A0A8E2JNW9_9PEZI|nr:hypothetical protein AOQ84DRAFT_367801 [Glonium stellatum]
MQRKSESRRPYLITSPFAKQACSVASLVKRGAFARGTDPREGRCAEKRPGRPVLGLGREKNRSPRDQLTAIGRKVKDLKGWIAGLSVSLHEGGSGWPDSGCDGGGAGDGSGSGSGSSEKV